MEHVLASRGVRLTLLVLATCLVVPLSKLSAQGDDTRALEEALVLQPGASCVAFEDLIAQVVGWLGADRLASDIQLEIVGDRADPRRVTFYLKRASVIRERRFERLPERCADSTAVVALAIALTIDASVLDELIPAQPATAEPVERSPDPAPTSEPLQPVPHEPSVARRLLTVQVATGHAVIPGTPVGGSLALAGVVAPWLRSELAALALASFKNQVPGTIGVFDATALGVLPRLCAGGQAAESVRFDLCVGATLGMLHVRGRNFLQSREQRGFWSILVAGAQLRFKLGIPWAFSVEGVFSLRVPAVSARNQDNQPRERKPDSAGVLVRLGPQFFF